MTDKLKIILECIGEILDKKSKEYPRVVTINELNKIIAFNSEAKAYDFIYGLTVEDFDTSEIIQILDRNNIAYEYQGKVKNSSRKMLFEGFYEIKKQGGIKDE